MKSKIKLVDVLEYGIALLAILDCNTVYSKIIGSSFTSFTPYIAVGLGMLLLVKLNKARVSLGNLWRCILFLGFYFVAIGMLYLNNGRFSPSPLGFVVKFFVTFPLLMLVFLFDSNCPYSIFKKYTNLMYVIAIVSLIFWILASQAHLLKPTTYFYVNWGNPFRYPVYAYVYVERQVEYFFGARIVRNIGFFAEAPMYSAALVIAMTLELFVGARSKAKVVIFYIAIITTFSTTGLLLGITVYVVDFMLLRVKSRNQFWVKLILGFAILIVRVISFVAIFMQKATSTLSWSGRLLSIVEGYKVMKDNPLYGCGYRSFKAYLKYMPAYRARANMGTGGSASGIGSLMGQCGLILTGIYLLSFWFYIVKSWKNGDSRRMIFALIMLVMLFFSVIQYTFIMLILIAYFYSECLNRESIELSFDRGYVS